MSTFHRAVGIAEPNHPGQPPSQGSAGVQWHSGDAALTALAQACAHQRSTGRPSNHPRDDGSSAASVPSSAASSSFPSSAFPPSGAKRSSKRRKADPGPTPTRQSPPAAAAAVTTAAPPRSYAVDYETTADTIHQLLDDDDVAGIDMVWVSLPALPPDHPESTALCCACFRALTLHRATSVIHPAAVATDELRRAWADILGCSHAVHDSVVVERDDDGDSTTLAAALGCCWRGTLTTASMAAPVSPRRSARANGKRRAGTAIPVPAADPGGGGTDWHGVTLTPLTSRHHQLLDLSLGDNLTNGTRADQAPARSPIAFEVLRSCSSSSVAHVLRCPVRYGVASHPSAPPQTHALLDVLGTASGPDDALLLRAVFAPAFKHLDRAGWMRHGVPVSGAGHVGHQPLSPSSDSQLRVLMLMSSSMVVGMDGAEVRRVVAEVIRPQSSWPELYGPVLPLVLQAQPGLPEGGTDATAAANTTTTTTACVAQTIGALPRFTATELCEDEDRLQGFQWDEVCSAAEPTDLVSSGLVGHRAYLQDRHSTQPQTRRRSKSGSSASNARKPLSPATWWEVRSGGGLLDELGREGDGDASAAESDSASPAGSDSELIPAAGVDVLAALKDLPEMRKLRTAASTAASGLSGRLPPKAKDNTADRVLRNREARPKRVPKVTLLAIPFDRMRLAAGGAAPAVAGAEASAIAASVGTEASAAVPPGPGVRRRGGGLRLATFGSLESMTSNKSVSSPWPSSFDYGRSPWEDAPNGSSPTNPTPPTDRDVPWRHNAALFPTMDFDELVARRDVGLTYCTESSEQRNRRLLDLQRRHVKEPTEGGSGLLLTKPATDRGRLTAARGTGAVRGGSRPHSRAASGISSPDSLIGPPSSPPIHHSSQDGAAAGAAADASVDAVQPYVQSKKRSTRDPARLLLASACKTVIRAQRRPTGQSERAYEALYSICKAIMKASRIQPSDTEAYAAEASKHARAHCDFVFDNLG